MYQWHETEFHELIDDVPATSTWFITPGAGNDASSRESWELLSFSVEGEPRKIELSAWKAGETYSFGIGDEVVAARQPVRHTYRAVADPVNHRLFLAISQPAYGVHVGLDYSATGITRMSVTNLVATSRRPYVSPLPAQVVGRELTIGVPGWVQAGSSFTFVWTLDSEEQPGAPHLLAPLLRPGTRTVRVQEPPLIISPPFVQAPFETPTTEWNVYMRMHNPGWPDRCGVSTGAPRDPWERYVRDLGVRLHRLRTERGLSQERLAAAAAISTYTYRKLEKGESNPGTAANPRLRTLVALAEALAVGLAELLPAEPIGIAVGR